MLLFLASVAALLLGYVFYGKVVDKAFGCDPNRPTPACTMADGVDFVEMSTFKVYLVQLLNIAGLGPIFGPILGALYGPASRARCTTTFPACSPCATTARPCPTWSA